MGIRDDTITPCPQQLYSCMRPDNVGRDSCSGRALVDVSPRYYRPAEVELLLILSDPSKARKELAWESVAGFDELVREMVDADCPTS